MCCYSLRTLGTTMHSGGVDAHQQKCCLVLLRFYMVRVLSNCQGVFVVPWSKVKACSMISRQHSTASPGCAVLTMVPVLSSHDFSSAYVCMCKPVTAAGCLVVGIWGLLFTFCQLHTSFRHERLQHFLPACFLLNMSGCWITTAAACVASMTTFKARHASH